MKNFLTEYNENPSQELLDQQWQAAAAADLHHSAMLFARISLEKRKKLNKATLPDCCRLYETISISGYYTKDRDDKKLAAELVEVLCTNRDIAAENRELARNNQLFYIQTLEQLIGPYTSKQLTYDLDWNVTNPSILNWRGELWLIQRSVNYEIDAHGRYNTGITDPIKTINYLVRLDSDLEIINCREIQRPDQWPEPVWNLVQGLEDCRLFNIQNRLYFTATVRECHPQGLCQTALFELDPDTAQPGPGRILDCPAPDLHQKNWMPFVDNHSIQFLYLSDPTIVINEHGTVIKQNRCSHNLDNFRGGGQVIRFESGYLAIIHESVILKNSLRDYVHRFITLDKNYCVNGFSPRFKFHGQRIEFAAGLCLDSNNKIIVSYGIQDRESWIARLDSQTIRDLIQPIPVVGHGPRGP